MPVRGKAPVLSYPRTGAVPVFLHVRRWARGQRRLCFAVILFVGEAKTIPAPQTQNLITFSGEGRAETVEIPFIQLDPAYKFLFTDATGFQAPALGDLPDFLHVHPYILPCINMLLLLR